MFSYRVFRKNCGFSQFTATPPSPTSLAVRDLQSSKQRNASVQSLLLADNFCTTNSSRVLARERWQNFENSREKNTMFNEHPVYQRVLLL